MEVEGWKLFAGLSVVVLVYAFGVGVLGAPPSLSGFAVLVVFSLGGLLLGRYLGERLSDS